MKDTELAAFTYCEETKKPYLTNISYAKPFTYCFGNNTLLWDRMSAKWIPVKYKEKLIPSTAL